MSDLELIGRKLKDTRERQGITRTQMMDQMKVSRSHLIRIERGGNTTLTTIINYLDVLGLKITFIRKERD